MDITFRTAGLAAAAGAGLALAIGCGIANAEADSPSHADSSAQATSTSSAHAQSKRVAAGPRAVSNPGPAAARVRPVRGSVPITARLRLAAQQAAAPEADVPGPDAPAPDAPAPQAHAEVTATPEPDDMTPTVYGDIGQWMLRPDGEIADWIGNPLDGKTLLEGINVIIIDPAPVPLDMAVRRLNRAMVMAGFPGVIFHSGGYQGLINGDTFQQQPKGAMVAFSDNFFLLPNNHGRIMGPFPPADGQGYIWIASLSREQLGEGPDGGLTHVFVSFNEARDALAEGLVERTGATNLGPVALNNAVPADDPTYTTGDADGYAAVIQLAV